MLSHSEAAFSLSQSAGYRTHSTVYVSRRVKREVINVREEQEERQRHPGQKTVSSHARWRNGPGSSAGVQTSITGHSRTAITV